MKTLFTFILCSILLNISILQSQEESTHSDDRVHKLLDKMNSFKGQGKINRDSLKYYAQQVLDLTDPINPTVERSKALSAMLIANYHEPFKKYKPIAEEAIECYNALEMPQQEMSERYYLAQKAHTAGFLIADSLYKTGLDQLSEKKEALGNKAYCYLWVRFKSSQSSHYDYNGLYQDAVNSIVEAIEKAESCQDSASLLNAYKSAGSILGKMSKSLEYDLGDPEELHRKIRLYLFKTYDLAKALKTDKTIALAAYNLAYMYRDQDSIELAIQYLNESQSIDDIQWMPRQRFYNFMLLSEITYELGNKTLAKKYLNLGLEAANELNEERINFISKMDLARWYDKENQIKDCLDILGELENEMMQNKELRYSYYLLLSEVLEKDNQSQKALEAYKKQIALNDSITQKSQQTQIAALLSQYDLQKVKTELAELQKSQLKEDIHNQRVLLVSSILALFLISIFVYLYLDGKRKEAQLRQKSIETEQRMFRSLMNPHFIFNTLGSIQSFLLDKDKGKEAAYYLTKFAKLIRQTLNQSQEEFIPLSEELNSIQNYLLLQQMRFEKSFDYEIKIDSAINPEAIQIPPMLMQPIIENAIQHGKVHTIEGGSIIIEFKILNNQFFASVHDNGIGLKKNAEANKKESFAINSIKRRLEIIKSRYDKNVDFELVENKDMGATATFTLPLKYSA